MNLATFLLLPCLAPQITSLTASYPHGDQLALELSPDGSRAFVAEGASIAMLDIGNPLGAAEPTLIASTDVPECATQALRFFLHPNGKPYLFIAGGTMGVWRLELCPGLPLTPCGAPPVFFQPPVMIDGAIEANFERKRCVDVAVVVGNGQTGNEPVLFALYAATSETGLSAPGPTELCAYKLMSDGTTQVFGTPITFQNTPAGTPRQLGYALATDPAPDRDSVYVALGKGGIHRVDAVGGTILQSTPPLLSFPSSNPPISIDNVTDLAVVRVHSGSIHKSFLYAALNYGKILEFDLSLPGSIPTVYSPGFKYITRLTATTDGGSNVLLAAAFTGDHALRAESPAPFRHTGLWTTICISPGITGVDADEPANSIPASGELMFFKRDPIAGSAFTRILDTFHPNTPVDPGHAFGSLVLRQHATADYLAYTCTNYGGTRVFRVQHPFPTGVIGLVPEVNQIRTYTQNKVFGLWEGAPSDVDSRVIISGLEAAPGVGEGMLFVDGGSTPIPIPHTHSGCPSGLPPPLCEGSCQLKSPEPFTGKIMGHALWRDPDSSNLQWVLSGSQKFIPVETPSPSCQCLDKCPSGDVTFGCICGLTPCTDFFWRAKQFDEPGRTVTYKLSRLDLTPTAVPDGLAMDGKWWQIETPDILSTGANGDETPAVDLVHAASDPRLDDDGVSLLVHGIRNSSKAGYFVYQPRVLMEQALATCSTPMAYEGKGEMLSWQQSGVQQITTHFELEGSCVASLASAPPCEVASGPRGLINSRNSVFGLTDPQGNRVWVNAIASGFPEVSPTVNPDVNPESTCLWRRYFGQPMAIFYDVTETGDTFAAPRMLRVAFATLPSTQNPDVDVRDSAWDVATKTYGTGPDARTYAFVGEFLGGVRAYDVSYDNLFPAATSPYIGSVYDADGNGPLSGIPVPNPVLLPVDSLKFPKDPYDAYGCNCVDLEVFGNYLYCALGRAGMGIVDITDPNDLELIAVIDTPGLALGITLRPDAGAPTGMQVIVGDSHCGVRLYE